MACITGKPARRADKAVTGSVRIMGCGRNQLLRLSYYKPTGKRVVFVHLPGRDLGASIVITYRAHQEPLDQI